MDSKSGLYNLIMIKHVCLPSFIDLNCDKTVVILIISEKTALCRSPQLEFGFQNATISSTRLKKD